MNFRSSLNPEEFNAKKRKLVGDAVFDSFSHPKPFKVGKMKLGIDESKTIKSKPHKFHVV